MRGAKDYYLQFVILRPNGTKNLSFEVLHVVQDDKMYGNMRVYEHQRKTRIAATAHQQIRTSARRIPGYQPSDVIPPWYSDNRVRFPPIFW
jgi:hypothetical protein